MSLTEKNGAFALVAPTPWSHLGNMYTFKIMCIYKIWLSLYKDTLYVSVKELRDLVHAVAELSMDIFMH